MPFNVGVNVLEVDGRAVPTIVAAPISVAGFLLRSERGIPNVPVAVGGLVDYSTGFGRPTAATLGAHAVRGFFDNGGMDSYVIRIVGAGSQAATVVLNDRAATPLPTLEIAAGRYGRRDPGAWGNSLAVTVSDHARATSAIPAQIVSSTSEPYGLADGQTLQVTVNGATPPVTVVFSSADFANIGGASCAEVAAVINRQTTSVRAVVTPTQRVALASSTPGARSRLAVAGTAATALGFTGGAANSDGGLAAGTTLAVVQSPGGLVPGSAVRIQSRGSVTATAAMAAAIPAGAGIAVTSDGGAAVMVTFTDSDFVGGVGAVTPGEVVAVINRQARGFTAALTHNDRLVLMSSSFGTGSTMAVAAPGGAVPDATAALGLTGATQVAGTRQFRALDFVSESQKVVAWTGGLAVPTNVARIQSAEFDLVVTRDGAELERFESLSMQNALDYYVESVINNPESGSGFVTVTDRNSASGPGLDTPANGRFQLGSTAVGSDGQAPSDTDYIGDPAARSGLYAFDPLAIQLLACPDTTSPGVVAAALSYCERRGDAMFVGSAPRGLDMEGVKSYAASFRGRKVYGALYAPWIQIVNPLDTTGVNPRLLVPPVGHVLGVYARLAEARGVWKAPAGDEAQLRNVLGVEFDMTDPDHSDLVKNGGVNGVRAIPGSGVIVDASRTLSMDTRWTYVNVRRLFNFVKLSLREGLRWVAQEPHSEDLRRTVRLNVVRPFLLGLWRQGAFGSDPPDQVFTIKCDAENNPPAEVDLGNFKVEVFFYPVKPAETIIIVVGQQESSAAAAEA